MARFKLPLCTYKKLSKRRIAVQVTTDQHCQHANPAIIINGRSIASGPSRHRVAEVETLERISALSSFSERAAQADSETEEKKLSPAAPPTRQIARRRCDQKGSDYEEAASLVRPAHDFSQTSRTNDNINFEETKKTTAHSLAATVYGPAHLLAMRNRVPLT